MGRRRIILDHEEDAAIVREVLAAVCQIIGAKVDDVLQDRAVMYPESMMLRQATSVALMRHGWSRSRSVHHCKGDRKNIHKAHMGDRLEQFAPHVLRAAEAAAAKAIGRRKIRGSIDAEAREVLRYEAAAAGLPVNVAATSKATPAREVRERVARRLYAMEFDGASIARVMGYGQTTIYRWIHDQDGKGRRRALREHEQAAASAVC